METERKRFAALWTTGQTVTDRVSWGVMASITDLIDHLEALLEPASYSDYAPNGLQVPGPAEVSTVVTGVSAGVGALRASRAPRART